MTFLVPFDIDMRVEQVGSLGDKNEHFGSTNSYLRWLTTPSLAWGVSKLEGGAELFGVFA